MNYVILNGVKSTLIKGLLIQSLPPISKPLMRTKKTEIDGRDGDILTNLGYSAYDKAMNIGLFGDFDIDEVIKFFTSEGTVIFSNEPDKYYNYKIVAQIDFERLIRFRTATVTFHVQPYKYSAVEDDVILESNLIHEKIYTLVQNGVTLTSKNGLITVKGTATKITSIYVPIKSASLGVGSYTLKATSSGTGMNACEMRLIGTVPTNADSFGGSAMALNGTLTDTLTEDKAFNYIYLSINPSIAMNFTLDTELTDNSLNSFDVFNRGNINSKPIMTITGAGTIKISLNGTEIFTINLADKGYISIDSAKLEAYKGNTLMNRYVEGDYNNLSLRSGNNTISWVGTVSQIEIENVSRWI